MTDCGALEGGYEKETLERISQLAKEHSVNYVVIESNFGDGMATALLIPVMAKIHPCSIEEVRHNIQKEKRIIDTLEPIFNQHRLVVAQEVIEKDFKQPIDHQLFKQITRITKDRGALRHDDALDALSIAANYWVERMDRDQTLAFEEHKETKLQVELDDFMEHSIGKPKRKKGWI